jgi:hypothetical protein
MWLKICLPVHPPRSSVRSKGGTESHQRHLGYREPVALGQPDEAGGLVEMTGRVHPWSRVEEQGPSAELARPRDASVEEGSAPSHSSGCTGRTCTPGTLTSAHD